MDRHLISFNGPSFRLREQANQALLNFNEPKDSFFTKAFLIRGMEYIKEKYGATMKEETMILLVENNSSSSKVALLAIPGSFPLLSSFLGTEASLSSSFSKGGLALTSHEGVLDVVSLNNDSGPQWMFLVDGTDGVC